MPRADRFEAVQRVNRDHPLNRAVSLLLPLLPDDWGGSRELYVLSLALWGLSEAGIRYRVPGGYPDEESIEAAILRLMAAGPDEAIDWLSCPNDDPEGGCLDAGMLSECEDARQAASRVIDEIGIGLGAGRQLP
jgi:hypothetical protein